MNVMFPFQKFQECKNDSHMHCMSHVLNAGTSFLLPRNSSSGKCYHGNSQSLDKRKISLSLSLQLNKPTNHIFGESVSVQLQAMDVLHTERQSFPQRIKQITQRSSNSPE